MRYSARRKVTAEQLSTLTGPLFFTSSENPIRAPLTSIKAVQAQTARPQQTDRWVSISAKRA